MNIDIYEGIIDQPGPCNEDMEAYFSNLEQKVFEQTESLMEFKDVMDEIYEDLLDQWCHFFTHPNGRDYIRLADALVPGTNCQISMEFRAHHIGSEWCEDCFENAIDFHSTEILDHDEDYVKSQQQKLHDLRLRILFYAEVLAADVFNKYGASMLETEFSYSGFRNLLLNHLLGFEFPQSQQSPDE